MRLFLKEHQGYILLYYFSVVLTTFYSVLVIDFPFLDIMYIILFNTFILLVFLVWKYVKTKGVYALLYRDFHALEVISLDKGSSFWSRQISMLLKQQYRLYELKLQQSNQKHQEHLIFINQWVHQMKTPLSVIQLQLESQAGTAYVSGIQEELYKIEKGLKMALSLARLDAFEKDFVIEKTRLQPLIMDCINQEKKQFITSGILPRANIDETIEVYTDVKWLKFIIEQLITNGIKYSKGKGKYVSISAYRRENEVVLEVTDEGIGIHPKDIRRVFDPFFTGANGRVRGESTGMGLYIANKVCENLHHSIQIQSEVNQGTKVIVRFGNLTSM